MKNWRRKTADLVLKCLMFSLFVIVVICLVFLLGELSSVDYGITLTIAGVLVMLCVVWMDKNLRN